MKRTFLAAAALAFSLPVFAAQTLEETAAHGLAAVQAFASARPAEFGFASAAEAASARLGEPVSIKFVGASDLGAFRPGQDAETLAKDIHGYLYPVVVGGDKRSPGDVRCLVKVGRFQGQWRVEELGLTTLARAMEPILRTYYGIADAGLGFLEIPAIHQYFLVSWGGRPPRRSVALILFDDPTIGVKAGDSMSLSQLFLSLAPRAAKAARSPVPGGDKP